MRFLLDTSVAVWASIDGPQLSRSCRDALADPANQLFVSYASIWEIAIKHRHTGRRIVHVDLAEFVEGLERAGYVLLPIELGHIIDAESLPLLHRDPFDRLIVSQARGEDMVLISRDDLIRQYDVATLW